MRIPYCIRKVLHYFLILFVGPVVIAACQSTENTPVPQPTEPKITAIPFQDLMTARPQETGLPDNAGTVPSESPSDSDATITPLPPPTLVPGPTNTATPVPAAKFHTIESGDTFSGIAEQYNVSIDALVIANGYSSLADVSLAIGDQIQIPYCEVHQVMPGNTMSSIAQLCGLTVDDLIVANIAGVATVGSLEGIPPGYVLVIPADSQTPEELDCGAQPPREQVIQYTPGLGEGPFCLSQKFGVSGSAIIQSNIDRLRQNTYGEVPLLIPPRDGTLYEATVDDVTRNATVADLADWYDVEVEAVTDWNGNPVSGQLVEGQQLLIIGANLFFGPFRSRPLAG